jgi:DNA-binding HxlR family transcriptional regulator
MPTPPSPPVGPPRRTAKDIEQTADAGGDTSYGLTVAGESLTAVLAEFAGWYCHYRRVRRHLG